MKAAFFETTGAPDVIRVRRPARPRSRRPGEVRVKVAAVGGQPDRHVHPRAARSPMPLPKPFITGCDLAGVGGRGRARASTRFKVGDRVWGSNQGLLGRQGTFAEFVLRRTRTGSTRRRPASRTRTRPPSRWSASPPTSACSSCAKLQAGRDGLRQRRHRRRRLDGRADGEGGRREGHHHRRVATRRRSWPASSGPTSSLNYKTDDVAAKVKEVDRREGRRTSGTRRSREPDFDRTVELMAPRGRIVVMAGRQARPAFPNGPFYVKGLSLFGFAMFNMTADEQRRVRRRHQPLAGRGQAEAEHRPADDAERDRGGAPVAGGEHASRGPGR